MTGYEKNGNGTAEFKGLLNDKISWDGCMDKKERLTTRNGTKEKVPCRGFKGYRIGYELEKVELDGKVFLYASVTMKSLEIAALGGGIVLQPQNSILSHYLSNFEGQEPVDKAKTQLPLSIVLFLQMMISFKLAVDSYFDQVE